MDYRIPDHDSTLDSIDRREQDKEEVDDYSEEDMWHNTDDENDDD